MKRWHLLALAAITISAFLLRLYHLDFQCLSFDETFTQHLARTNASYIMEYAWTIDPNPPLFYLLSHAMINIFGDTAFVIRFPSVIFSTLSIPVVYLIGKEYRNELLGLLVAATVAFSYNMIWFGQDARAYALVYLAFGVLVLSFLKLCKTGNWKYYIPLTAAAVVALWSHAYSFIPISLILLYVIVRNWKESLYWIAVIVGFCQPYILYIWVAKNRTMEIASYGYNWYETLMLLPTEIFWYVGAVFVPPFIVWMYNNRGRIFSPEVYLAIVAIITIASMLPLAFLTPMFPRYALPVMPIVLSAGLYHIADFVHSRTPEQQASILLLWIFLVAASSYMTLHSWYFDYGCIYTAPLSLHQYT